jgi:hypothetical protein
MASGVLPGSHFGVQCLTLVLCVSDATVVPATAIRRNVTQRRSRGKERDEGDRAPDPALLNRRPRSRSKDSLEPTGGEHECECQDWRATRALVPPSRTSPSTYQGTPRGFPAEGYSAGVSSSSSPRPKVVGLQSQWGDSLRLGTENMAMGRNRAPPHSGRLSDRTSQVLDRTRPFLNGMDDRMRYGD